MIMLDLCAGLGGAHKAMLDRGWTVITVDNDPRFNCTYTADLTTWHYDGPRPDLVWASPPCTEFARESMPWCKTGRAPDMTLVRAARRLISEIQPRYWCIENVRGAVRYIGQPTAIHGPFFLWANLPPLGRVALRMRNKESYSSKQQAERAMVPYALSEAIAITIERQHCFQEVSA